AIAVVVEEASTRRLRGKWRGSLQRIRIRSGPKTRCIRRVDELNLNRGRNLFRENRRFFCPRILALLAISQTHRRADFILRDVMETLEVLAGMLGVAGLLVGARKPEFRRRVQRVQLECMLESFNGLRILLGL